MLSTIVVFANAETNNYNQMKAKVKREFREKILKNNIMQRFIREIEREAPLDNYTLQTMLAYQPQTVR